MVLQKRLRHFWWNSDDFCENGNSGFLPRKTSPRSYLKEQLDYHLEFNKRISFVNKLKPISVPFYRQCTFCGSLQHFLSINEICNNDKFKMAFVGDMGLLF